ncbi:hypothetical protein ACJX0J_034426, partial [Zea mays]
CYIFAMWIRPLLFFFFFRTQDSTFFLFNPVHERLNNAKERRSYRESHKDRAHIVIKVIITNKHLHAETKGPMLLHV